MLKDENIHKTFFDLLQSGLGYVPSKDIEIPKGFDWEKIYQLASEQSVIGIVLAGIERLKNDNANLYIGQMLLLQWIGEVQMLEQQNFAMNKELAEFSSLCKDRSAEYIVVKGQTVGCLYPKPELRQAGDIDFLIHGSSANETTGLMTSLKIQDYAGALGVEIPKMVEHEVGFDRNEIRYELHTNLRIWAKKEHQKVWDALVEKEWEHEHYVEIEGEKVRTLSPTLNAAYIFIHLFFHFIREGVSIRQM